MISSTPRPLAALDSVSKIYPSGTEALRDFSLTIGRPEFISLLGPSGCGKSTVLKILSGLSPPSGGLITWPALAKDAKPDLGYVFQDATLMPWATVFDNVHLPLKIAGIRRADAEERIKAALARVGLSAFAKAYPRELSGGMRMRVSVARALLTQPALLLMDEPFAALDEITRFELIEDLLSLWQGQDWSAVFVTHSVFESVYMSQRVVVMAAQPGRVFTEIAIDEPFPRTPAYRGTPRYSAACAQVLEALRAASLAKMSPAKMGMAGKSKK